MDGSLSCCLTCTVSIVYGQRILVVGKKEKLNSISEDYSFYGNQRIVIFKWLNARIDRKWEIYAVSFYSIRAIMSWVYCTIIMVVENHQ